MGWMQHAASHCGADMSPKKTGYVYKMSNMGMLFGHTNIWNAWKHGRLGKPAGGLASLCNWQVTFARLWNRLSRVVSFKQSCPLKTSFCQSNSWYVIRMYTCCMHEQTLCRIMPDGFFFLPLLVAKVAIIDIKMYEKWQSSLGRFTKIWL
jgi:hypothetical protein